VHAFAEEQANYNDAGMVIPEVFLLYKNRIADFSSILQIEQLRGLVQAELEGLPGDEPVVIITHKRG
jgi:hypothetical protein